MGAINAQDWSLQQLAFNEQGKGNKVQYTYDADGDIVTLTKTDFNGDVIVVITFTYYAAVVTPENLSGKKQLKATETTTLNR